MKEVYDLGLLQILPLNRPIINSVKTHRSIFGLEWTAGMGESDHGGLLQVWWGAQKEGSTILRIM